MMCLCVKRVSQGVSEGGHPYGPSVTPSMRERRTRPAQQPGVQKSILYVPVGFLHMLVVESGGRSIGLEEFFHGKRRLECLPSRAAGRETVGTAIGHKSQSEPAGRQQRRRQTGHEDQEHQ
jgi:hypothetical protein